MATQLQGDTTEIQVRYVETDQMGRAHHMHYVAWFELGRTELMRKNGVSYAEMERAGILLPVTHLEIEYREGIGYEESARVHTRVVSVRSRSITFAYELRRFEDGRLLARGSTVLMCTGPDGRPRRLPQSVAPMLARLVDRATPG